MRAVLPGCGPTLLTDAPGDRPPPSLPPPYPQVALAMECKWRGLRVAPYLLRWVDLKAAFNRAHKRSGNLRACVEAAGLKWEGRAHCGLDDARNEARLACHLMCRGVRLGVTGAFPTDAPHSAAAAGKGQQEQGQAQAGVSLGVGGSQGQAAASAGGGPGGGARRQALLAPLRSEGSGAVATHDKSGRWLGICKCGAKAAPRVTKKPGPNHGRSFYSCGNWRMLARGGRQPCDFFQWADA